jgi:hypothetical protein
MRPVNTITCRQVGAFKLERVQRDVKVSVPQIDGRRPNTWPEGVAHILDRLHAEVWGVQVRRVQLFQVEN